MRLFGCALLVSGWLIVLAALMLLRTLEERLGFVIAGIGIECLGLGLIMQWYRMVQGRTG